MNIENVVLAISLTISLFLINFMLKIYKVIKHYDQYKPVANDYTAYTNEEIEQQYKDYYSQENMQKIKEHEQSEEYQEWLKSWQNKYLISEIKRTKK